MNRPRKLLALLPVVGFALLAAGAWASPVVYTLATVADGKIGNQPFSQALVTFTMHSDTAYVQSSPGQNGGNLYVNRTGRVTVSIRRAGQPTIRATLLPGEAFVRYDTGLGVAGFGSPIGPTYPLTLGCVNYPYPDAQTYVSDCLQGDPYEGTLGALAQPGLDSYSPELLALPPSLSQNTVLSGTMHSCAGIYGVTPDGTLTACVTPAPRALKTDVGGLTMQDAIGGTLPGAGYYLWDGWDLANRGNLKVEVLP